MRHAARLYRLLLGLYPARFREEYAAAMERQFLDEYREARGRRGHAAFWLRTAGDLVRSVPALAAREFAGDVRYALRVYSRRPAVSLLAVAALALAIGATTGVFSVVNALLLRSLPFRDPGRLVRLMPSQGMDTSSSFHKWAGESRYLEDAVSFNRAEMNLGAAAGSARVAVTETSSNFFSMLGAEPVIGRGFLEGEDAHGAPLVAVIAYGLFEQLFGGDTRALGSSISLNGQPATVVGVARRGFDYPNRTAVWTATTFEFPRLPKTGVTFWETIGRVKPRVSWAQADAMFEADHANDDRSAPKGFERPRPRLVPLREELAGPVQQASLVLMGAVAFVLLIACANIANLLLTRITERRTELTIRATLGASRARLVQQLVTESLLISLVAAAAGLVVAAWAARLAAAAQPAQVAFQEYSVLEPRVLAFAIVIAAVTAIVFGVVPAAMAGRLQPAETLVRHQAGGRDAGAGRMRRLLLAAQVALTIVLLAGSIVMGRGFLSLVGTDLGFRTRDVVTMNVSLSGTRHDADDRRGPFFRAALARLRAVPGVASAGAVDFLPLAAGAYMGAQFDVEGGRSAGAATVVTVTPDYFRTMGTAVLSGREFNDADTPQAERVAIVTDAFARAAGEGARTVVGKRIVSPLGKTPLRVVGVVQTARFRGPAGSVVPQVFLPYAQRAGSFNLMTLVAWVDDVRSRLPMAREAVEAVDPLVPVFAARTLDDRLRETLAKPRFYTATILFLGGFALLLSIVGIYGVSSYSVMQRTHEIGVRMAIGASPSGIRSMLMRQSLVPVAAGVAIGIPAALAAGRHLAHLLTPIEPLDAATCAWAASALALVSAVAVRSSIARVMRSNPLAALRAE